jgi:hypothetical protein
MKHNLKFVVILLVASALVVVFLPWKTKVVPAVRIQVFDETGKPAARVRVEQEWVYTALDSYFQNAVTESDSDGYVAFPERTIRISPARKTIGFMANMLPLMCAYGFGASGSISAHGVDSQSYDIVICDVNNPNPRPLKLTRRDDASN